MSVFHGEDLERFGRRSLTSAGSWIEASYARTEPPEVSAARRGPPCICSEAGGREAEDLRSRETPVPSPPGSRGSSGSQFNADTATGGAQNTSPSVLGSASTILKPAAKSDPSAVERGRRSERHLRLHRLLCRESPRAAPSSSGQTEPGPGGKLTGPGQPGRAAVKKWARRARGVARGHCFPDP
uniref:SH3 and multiple ankyrin repeat domains protein 1-like n=1 Tax=Callithrix jacchus TaxID=9483 RepID=UPI0023DD50E2|nr:SH3 and multiple ankyrin repeat domains protein 1-like [Callithrix jacchus]